MLGMVFEYIAHTNRSERVVGACGIKHYKIEDIHLAIFTFPAFFPPVLLVLTSFVVRWFFALCAFCSPADSMAQIRAATAT